MKINKFISISLLLLVFNSYAQRDSSSWHFGVNASYLIAVYPNHSPFSSYSFSQGCGIGLLGKYSFKKMKKLSTSFLVEYNRLNFNQVLPDLDTSNLKYPYNKSEMIFKNITFNYDIITLNATFETQLKRKFNFGFGFLIKTFFLNNVQGYTPYIYSEYDWLHQKYVDHTIDYSYNNGPNTFTYLNLSGSYIPFNSHFIQLKLIINPFTYTEWKLLKNNPFDGYGLRAGIIYSASNFVNINYTYFFK